jgi:hypothetical protein
MPSPAPTTRDRRRPTQGAVVVLLGGLMLINLFTLVLVMTGGDKPDPPTDTRAADATPTPDTARPVTATRTPETPATATAGTEDDAASPDPPPHLIVPAATDADPPAHRPHPDSAAPRFFGLPLFE